jgi:OmcA/MtrC family decaheme c-type cytochrome
MDPNSGNALDFKVFIHKIHMGENLPSVAAGKPFYIGATPETGSDFSSVIFPRDIRNCETCHKKASQAGNWRTHPGRDTCGSCHDNINWMTGDNHVAGPQQDDASCANASCHPPQSGSEYDGSIAGAHTVPFRSKQLRNPKFEIVGVSNTGPGQKPAVQFKITDKNSIPIAPAEMARLSLRLAGPTSEYHWYILESALKANYANGVATYGFTGSLPADATGTYSVGIEGYLNTKLNPGTAKELVYRDAGDNVLSLFAVTGQLTPRRVVVDLAKCNQCHDKLQHHSSRNDPQYCVGCHNPTMTDGARRPADQGDAQSIHFKVMIHRIHTGKDLTTDFTIWGGSPSNFNNVAFPGDRRDCTTCHAGTSYTLPLAPGLRPSVTPRWFWTPTQPTAAACLACHDSIDVASHAFVNTSDIDESCAVCHGEGTDSAVTKVHAR